MARFNTLTTAQQKTENLAGGEAYSESPKLEFASLVLTSFVNDQFYRKASESLQKVKKLVDSVPPDFAAKVALFARREYGMRSISHAVAGELARHVSGHPWARRFFAKIVYRPDDITEILAYYFNNNEGRKTLPSALKYGLAQSFDQFNAYQLGKYRGERNTVSLVDAVNLLHPRPTKNNAEALTMLVTSRLRSTDTWELMLTRAGQDAEDDEGKDELKQKAWASLISERKIGYFAVLRNLRNIMEQAPESLDAALEMLQDEHLIRKSLVLPFRFQTALKAISETQADGGRKVVQALSNALDISCKSVPRLLGKTLIAVDHSGSMIGKPMEIAQLFGAILYKSQEADLMVFSSDAQWLMLNPADSTLSLAEAIERSMEAGGTNFHSIFERATKFYDRFIILSDMQAWMDYTTPSEALRDYCRRTGAAPHIFSWDLNGYGTLQFPERRVYALAGFSEKVFDLMALLEQDRDALVRRIEQVEL